MKLIALLLISFLCAANTSVASAQEYDPVWQDPLIIPRMEGK